MTGTKTEKRLTPELAWRAAGWLWLALKKLKANEYVALPVVGFLGSMTNTVTVMGSIYVLFRAEYAAANNKAVSVVFDFIMATVTGAGVMEAVVALVLVTAIGKALLKVMRPVQRTGAV